MHAADILSPAHRPAASHRPARSRLRTVSPRRATMAAAAGDGLRCPVQLSTMQSQPGAAVQMSAEQDAELQLEQESGQAVLVLCKGGVPQHRLPVDSGQASRAQRVEAGCRES